MTLTKKKEEITNSCSFDPRVLFSFFFFFSKNDSARVHYLVHRTCFSSKIESNTVALKDAKEREDFKITNTLLPKF